MPANNFGSSKMDDEAIRRWGRRNYPNVQFVVERKRIKHMNLYVQPGPRIRISFPPQTLPEDVLTFLESRREWLDRTLAECMKRPVPADTGADDEAIRLWGSRNYPDVPFVVERSKGRSMELSVQPGPRIRLVLPQIALREEVLAFLESRRKWMNEAVAECMRFPIPADTDADDEAIRLWASRNYPDVPFVVERKKGQRMDLGVFPGPRIHLVLPQLAPRKDALAFLESHREWVNEAIAARRRQMPVDTDADDEAIRLWGSRNYPNVPFVVERKKIKSLRLTVYPDPRIRLALAPHMGKEQVLAFLERRKDWIDEKLAGYLNRP